MAKGKYEEWLQPEGLLKIEGWARDGLTDKQIAIDKIGISERTFTEWKTKYSAISSVLKKGKEVIDRQVENALLKRALGYQYNEVKKEEYYNQEGELVEKKTVITKEVIPDTTAQIFWLKNRKPNDWRDKQNIEHSGEIKTNNPFTELTTEELKKLIGGG